MNMLINFQGNRVLLRYLIIFLHRVSVNEHQEIHLKGIFCPTMLCNPKLVKNDGDFFLQWLYL